MELPVKGPPGPLPPRAFALPTPGEIKIPRRIFTPPGVKQQLKIFWDDFLGAGAPHAFITFPHPPSQPRALTSPRSTM